MSFADPHSPREQARIAALRGVAPPFFPAFRLCWYVRRSYSPYKQVGKTHFIVLAVASEEDTKRRSYAALRREIAFCDIHNGDGRTNEWVRTFQEAVLPLPLFRLENPREIWPYITLIATSADFEASIGGLRKSSLFWMQERNAFIGEHRWTYTTPWIDTIVQRNKRKGLIVTPGRDIE